MSYTYNGRLAPAVGSGLGGLPRRKTPDAGGSVSALSGAVFFGEASNTSTANKRIWDNCLAKLTASKFLTVYFDNTSLNVTGVVSDVVRNGNSSSANQTVLSGLTAVNDLCVVGMTESSAMIVVLDGTTVKAGIVTISGQTITANTFYTVATGASGSICAEKNGDNDVVLAYSSSADATLSATALTIAGTVVSANAVYSVITGATGISNMSIIKSASGVFVCAYTVSGPQLRAVVMSVSGTVISFGSSALVTASTTSVRAGGSAIASDKIIIGSSNASAQAFCCVLSLSGLAISVGSIFTFTAFGSVFTGGFVCGVSSDKSYAYFTGFSVDAFYVFTLDVVDTLSITARDFVNKIPSKAYSLSKLSCALISDSIIAMASSNTSSTFARSIVTAKIA